MKIPFLAASCLAACASLSAAEPPVLGSLREMVALESLAPAPGFRAGPVDPGAELRGYSWFKRRFLFACKPEAASLAGTWRQSGWVTELPPKLGWHDAAHPKKTRALVFSAGASGLQAAAVDLIPGLSADAAAVEASGRAISFRLAESMPTGTVLFECRTAREELVCRLEERSVGFDGLIHYMAFTRAGAESR